MTVLCTGYLAIRQHAALDHPSNLIISNLGFAEVCVSKPNSNKNQNHQLTQAAAEDYKIGIGYRQRFKSSTRTTTGGALFSRQTMVIISP